MKLKSSLKAFVFKSSLKLLSSSQLLQRSQKRSQVLCFQVNCFAFKSIMMLPFKYFREGLKQV